MINATPNGDISFEMAKGDVLNEEIRGKTHDTSSHLEMFVIKNRRNQKKRTKGW